jgi:ribose transport system ATP-binding protein
MRSAPLLEAEGISKRFHVVQALQDVALHLQEHEVLGLVGENGSGKSTLLSVLSGVVRPNAGEIRVRGKPIAPRNYHDANAVGIFRIYQEQALLANLSVAENLYIGHESFFSRLGFLNRRAMIDRARRELEILDVGVDPTARLATLDMHTRELVEIVRAVATASLLQIDTPILLLDEPTATLTAEQVDKLFDLIRIMRERASFVFVSHRLSEVLDLSDRAYVLKDGVMIGEVSPRTISDSQLHQLMVGRVKEREYYHEDKQQDTVGPTVFRVEHLSAPPFFADVSFDLRKCEILGIGGLIGSGKSELGRALIGDLRASEGAVSLNGSAIHRLPLRTRISLGGGYVPLERHVEGILLYQSLATNISLPVLSSVVGRIPAILSPAREGALARSAMNRFAIAAPSERSLVVAMSGGNQQKTVIAKWLATNARSVLIMDNPTRGVDAGAKYEIYGLLRQLVAEGLAIILITDDLLELIGLSNRIVILRDGAVVSEIDAPAHRKPSEHDVIAHMV